MVYDTKCSTNKIKERSDRKRLRATKLILWSTYFVYQETPYDFVKPI